MNHTRTLVNSPSVLHRLLLTFATALLLIAGLLAMHTLATGHAQTPGATAVAPAVAHATPGSALGGTVSTGVMPTTMSVTGSDPAAGRYQGDCGGSSEMPEHPMLLMACVLVLLAAAVVGLAVALPVRRDTALALLRMHGRNVLAALPHPRPPSLIVLSISRT